MSARAGFFSGVLALCAAAAAPAATLFIHDATVHTQSAAGVRAHTDILIEEGRITALGNALTAPAGARTIEAQGRPVTPGLFGGLGHLGLEEIGIEPSVDDFELKLGAMRPEFDVTPAFDTESVTLGVARVGGVTFAQLAPDAEPGDAGHGGSVIAGQGAVVRLDGSIDAHRALFVYGGGDYSGLAGSSRAGLYLLLQQAVTEVRSPKLLAPGDARLLTPAGRQALGVYLGGGAPVVFAAQRASDIQQVIALAQREHLHAAVRGGAEAWRVADELARARVAVILDPFDDLPDSFDKVGATLENAARLERAGVRIVFSFGDPQPHNIRKLRQGAGIAVAHGLPPEAALAALTRNPAELLGVADRNGSIERGRPADLVLWSGDPLEVTSLPQLVIIQGIEQSMRSRQSELRDRYLVKLRAHQAR
jgi:imidazolonepropionase-like amidohydrolase